MEVVAEWEEEEDEEPDGSSLLDEVEDVIPRNLSEHIRLPINYGWPNETRIDLSNEDVTELPVSPDCPNLTTLFLQMNPDLTSIPASFFELMPSLEEVDLSNTSIKSLPQSFFDLVALQRLFLRNCQVFMELPALIGLLHNLEVLDLEGTDIIQLPAEVGELIKLTCLKASFCQCSGDLGETTMVPEGTLSKLAQLVELCIDVDPEDSRWEGDVQVVIKELVHLRKLKYLKMYVPQVELLGELTANLPFLLGSSTTGFNLDVGSHMRRVMSPTPLGAEGKSEHTKKQLRYVNGEGSIPSQVKNLLKYSESLFLDRHFTVRKLSEFGMENLGNLRYCMLGECNELKTVVEDWDGHDLHTRPVLPEIQQLIIYSMKTLTSISNAPLKNNSLRLLKTLKLHGCAQLRTIFVIESGIALVHLEEITVEDCPAVLSLIACNNSHDQIGWSFPNLKKICLHYLTELQSIFSGLCNAPYLERLSVYDCPNLKTLSAEEITGVDHLKVIRGEEEWWKALEWNETEWKEDCLQKLVTVFVPIRSDADLKTQLAQDPIPEPEPITQMNDCEDEVRSHPSIAPPLVSPVVGDIIAGLKKTLASSKNLGETFKVLNEVAEELHTWLKDCEAKVKIDPSKITTASYDLWRSKVLAIRVEMEGIEKEYNNRPSRYHFLQRSKLEEKMANKCSDYIHLLEDGYGQDERGFLVDKPPEPIIKMIAADIRGFPTLQSPLESILKSLKHDSIKLIAIHGMIGVGKTTVMLNLNNHEEVATLFDMVIWVKLPTDERDLRQAIAQRLELHKKGITDPDSKIISQELKNKKCLLLLDDVAVNLDLCEVGVPEGSKVVMTTRSRLDCNPMPDEVITLQPLSAEEAWKMFREITAEVLHLPGIEVLARKVADKCARLPLLLKAVASSFKLVDNAALWRVGLKNLHRWPEAGIQGVQEMYEFLKFSYDNLRDDTARQCFLYGALFPADSRIYTNYLIECWIAEGFFGNFADDAKSFEDMRGVGYDTLHHLTEVSLMDKGDKMIYVSMNNCIREFALHVLSQHPHQRVVVESGSPEEWQQANRVSMIGDKPCDLPESSKCSVLLTLLLQRNSKLVTIPPLFFKDMGRLVVLDLSGTAIESLPSSVAYLSALKALYLNDCTSLSELPYEIAKLEQLEVLDIRGSGISFIPHHIQYLLNLRSLRMSYNKSCERGDEECYAEVISKLAKLEELIINVISSYNEWCKEVEYVVRQVAVLGNLTTLRFCFPKLEHLETFMTMNSSWRDHLSSFRFFIGCPSLKCPPILQQFEYKIDRYLRYCAGDLKDNNIICEILGASQVLELIDHKNMTTLSDFMGIGRLEDVRGCLIQRCNLMRCVFEGQLEQRSLSGLQVLELKGCPKLTMIVSKGAIKQLSELRKLTVEECAEIEELIVEPDDGGSVLPKLETLRLVKLPKLRTICADQSLSWPSLETVDIAGCPELKTFPFNKDNAARLGYITGKREWWGTLEWQDTTVKKQLERFCSFR